MSWTNVKPILDNSMSDFSAEVAYRSAARALPQISAGFTLSRHAKERETPAIQAILRGLMTSRICIEALSTEALVAAHHAGEMLDRYNHLFAYVVRATKSALCAASSIRRAEKIHHVRIAVQATFDAYQNGFRYLPEKTNDASYVDAWRAAEIDSRAYDRSKKISTILPDRYIRSSTWKNFEEHLLGFDDSWKIWIHWLKYRLFHISPEDIPGIALSRAEKRMALQPDNIWHGSELLLNSTFSRLVLEEVDILIEEEADREQNSLGVRFFVSDQNIIDIGSPNDTDSTTAIKSIIDEVKSAAKETVELCNDNSEADTKSRVRNYLKSFSKDGWSDEMILIMRGDSLRKSLQFQIDRDDDSDIPPISQSTQQSLERLVRSHNLMVGVHPNLLKLDKLLSSTSLSKEGVGVTDLRRLAESAEHRHAVSVRAAEIIEEARDKLASDSLLREKVAADQTYGNFLRVVVTYLWKQRNKLIAAGSATGGLYALGNWAVSNQVIILKYFEGNQSMTVLLKRLYDILNSLPLL